MRPKLDLLSVSADPKTVKGEELGYVTGILYMAPSWLSGFNTCPMASKGCILGCLNKAGLGGVYTSVQTARIRKAQMFFNDRANFMAKLVKDVKAVIRAAKKYRMIPCFRFNGTSDIRWETVPCVVDGVEYANIMLAFPDVAFYDYTKIENRRNIPANYHLTFSVNEDNEAAARRLLALGWNIAVVFAGKIPSTWWGADVIIGDDSDLRFLDRKGCVVALTAKGPAKKDVSGFVKRVA